VLFTRLDAASARELGRYARPSEAFAVADRHRDELVNDGWTVVGSEFAYGYRWAPRLARDLEEIVVEVRAD
jgi:hypothetical protein